MKDKSFCPRIADRCCPQPSSENKDPSRRREKSQHYCNLAMSFGATQLKCPSNRTSLRRFIFTRKEHPIVATVMIDLPHHQLRQPATLEIEPKHRLRKRIDLIFARAIWKRPSLGQQVVRPRAIRRMRQIHVPRPHIRRRRIPSRLLVPSTSTGTSPGISPSSICITAGSLALSSINFVLPLGYCRFTECPVEEHSVLWPGFVKRYVPFLSQN